MASALIKKFSASGNPSDGTPLVEPFDEASLANSGTSSMSGNFRQMRLQEQPASSVSTQRPSRHRDGAFERGDSTPKSPGGSVLARVQMFEAHNASTSPVIGYKVSPSRNKAAGAEDKFRVKSKLPTTAPITSSSKDSNRFRPSTAPLIDVPVLERTQMKFHQIVSNPTPEDPAHNSRKLKPRWEQKTNEVHESRKKERTQMKFHQIVSNPTPEEPVHNPRKLKSRWEQKTDEMHDSREKNFTSSIPDTVEQAVDKAIAESKELSEKRRKLALFKKKAADARSNDVVDRPSHSNTTNARMTPDPLDREAAKKQDTDMLSSPNRRRKFKMVEASMKRNLLKDKSLGSSTADSSSSSISFTSVDFGAEPGAITPKGALERKNDIIHLDRVLPTIKSSEKCSFEIDDDFVVSPSSLPGKRDRHRSARRSDFTSSANPDISDGEDMGQSSFGQDSVESPIRTSQRSRGFRYTENDQQIFDMHDAQFSTPSPKQHQSMVNHGQSPTQGHYFAPIVLEGTPHLSFNDDGDDETQFNSVQENCDKSKSKDSSQPFAGNASSPNSHGASTKGSDGASYFFAGSARMAGDDFQDHNFTQKNVKYLNGATTEPPRDDDADSYTDNGSWTGHMRARKAMEQTTTSEKNDQRIDRRWNGKAPKKSVSHHLDGNISVTSRVINTVQKQQKAAMSDAQEGFNAFTTEDPKNAAIGLGVAGALCGAIMLGPLGIVLGAAGAGVGYKVSQMQEDERTEAKSKASIAIHKLQKSAIAANETISTTCATACGNSREEVHSNPINQTTGRSNGATFSPPQPVMQNQGLINQNRDRHPVGMNLKVSNVHIKPKDIVPIKSDLNQIHPSRARQRRRLTPACRRMGRITPVRQIHSLDPALHPLAWLDVMACDWTTRDEKNEAMEEILLLAKNKVRYMNVF